MQAWLALLVATLATAMAASCSSDYGNGNGGDTPLPDPVTLTVADISVGMTEAYVSVTPSSDEGYYYVGIYTADEIKYTDDESLATSIVKANGFADKLKTGTLTMRYADLRASTSYVVVAFGWNGRDRSAMVRHELATQEKPREQVAADYIDADYMGDVRNSGFDNFVVYMGNAPHDGATVLGLGDVYTFSIYTREKADSDAPLPFEGAYTLLDSSANGLADHCMDMDESRCFTVTRFVSADDNTLMDKLYLNGTLTIRKNTDGTYTATAVIDLEDGSKKEVTHTGPISVRDCRTSGRTVAGD